MSDIHYIISYEVSAVDVVNTESETAGRCGVLLVSSVMSPTCCVLSLCRVLVTDSCKGGGLDTRSSPEIKQQSML